MIKIPIKPLTPPIKITKPASQQPAAAAKPGAGASGKKPSGGSGSSGGSAESRIPSFESLFAEMLQHYLPETVAFTPLSEEVLSETIRSWLRPAYEQAIRGRRDQTERINAELDADAWSRGMGQSTYLTDVKERQLEHESRDVDALESDYASTLAQHLYDAMKAQQSEKLEVDRFNAEQINQAREKAAAAARALYQAYLSGASRGSGTSSAKTNETGTAASFTETVMNGRPEPNKVDFKTAENLVARMTPEQRRRLYSDYDPTYAAVRYDILTNFGRPGLVTLMHKYPA